jgi:hypothetical protein
MTNKTFKEEVEQKFDKEFDENLYVTVPTDMDVKVSKVKYFIFTALDAQKKKILEALPKPPTTRCLSQTLVLPCTCGECTEIRVLSEVKHIIENI